jgi:competence protein ComFC
MLLDSGCVVCHKTPGPVCVTCKATLRPAGQLAVPGLDRCRVGFALDDHSRPIIAAFKYRRQRRIARWLANEFANLVPLSAEVITWVPATPERRRTRGFDQAQELARALSGLTSIPTVELLRRDSDDQRQTGRSRSERLAGPALRSVRAAPQFVVLIDDVVTTGSSMRSAAAAIRGGRRSDGDVAEPQRIVGVAIAATPSLRDVYFHDLTNGSSIHPWT